LNRPVTIALLGDLAFNGCYAEGAPGNCADAFDAAGRILRQADLVVGNLECAIRTGTPRQGKIPVSTTAKALGLLARLNIQVVNLANNHVFDHGAAGFRRLVKTLDRLGVKHFGAGETREEAEKVLHIQLGGKVVGLIGFCSEDTHPGMAEGLHLNLYHPVRAPNLVRDASRSVDHLIVCMHWGEEWLSMPSPSQRAAARDLIRAGAAVVAGHHAHALQGWERIRNGAVFYSLGNAVFDDVRENGRLYVRQTPLTQECAVAWTTLDEGLPRVSITPGRSRHGLELQPEVDGEKRIARLNRKLSKRCYTIRYAVHRRIRTITMKYVSQYLLGIGIRESLRRLCKKRRRREGPVILYGAGREGGYYVRNQRLLKRLEEQFQGRKILLVAPKGDPLLKAALPSSIEKRESLLAAGPLFLRAPWIQVWLPLFCLIKRAPAVVGLNGFGPRFAPCKRIVFVNNARPVSPIFLALPGLPLKTRWTVRMQRFFMGLGLKGADRIGVQREGMITGIRALWNIPRERFEVVPNSAPGMEEQGEGKSGFRIRGRFPRRTVFFYPALYARHKNFECLLRAVEQLRQNDPDGSNILVALTLDADSRGHENGADKFVQRLKASKARDLFLLLGEAPHGQVLGLYGEADVVLYPAVCDSFSAVFLEAMQSRRPILAAGVDHALEVCGDAAEYFTWNDPASLAAAMRRLAKNPERRDALVAKGLERIGRYTPDREVKGMISLLGLHEEKASGRGEERA
jgi:poly-gamma-glutamate synthesis protein (capsule biosynthesis protein)